MEIIITAFWWILLYEEETARDVKKGDQLKMYLNICIHSVPILSMLGNVIISKVFFIVDHYPYFVAKASFYTFVNFAATIILGEVIYSFLPWNDYVSAFIALGVILIALLMYLTICYVLNIIRSPVKKDVHTN